MDGADLSDIQKLGLEAAAYAAGAEAVGGVDVAHAVDLQDRPAYRFSVFIHQDRAYQRLGLVRIRLIQKLLDELEARGDAHRPLIRILDENDWAARPNAQSF